MCFFGRGPKFVQPSTKKRHFLYAHTNDADFLQMEKGDMIVRILFSCRNTIQTKAYVLSFVLFLWYTGS